MPALRIPLVVTFLLASVTAARTAPQSPPTPGPPTQTTRAPAPRTGPSDTPLGTLRNFLRAFDEQVGDWQNHAIACLEAPAAMNRQDRWDVALKLLGILNRTTDRIAEEHAPEIRDGRALYFPNEDHFPLATAVADDAGKIELVLRSDRWLFSAETIRTADALYDALLELRQRRIGANEEDLMASLWVRRLMPASLRKELLTLEYWQWLGLFLIVLIGIILDYTVRGLLRRATVRTLDRISTYVSRETTTRAVRPIGLCAAAFLWVALLPLIGLTGMPLTILRGAVALFAVLAGTWAAWRILDLASEAAAFKASRTETKLDDILIPLIRKSVKIFIVIFGVIYAAESLDIEIAPLIASLGIGGLAFAFAAKDTIENFFGSVAVLVDRPFQVGDWIVVGEIEGIVEELGFRSTRVRTFYNSLVTLPNSTLVRATVDNYGKRKYRRTKCHISVQYDTSPEKLLAFREGIMELVRTHPYTRKDYYQVWFHEFGPSSLDILLYVFFEVPDWSTELRERERLFLDILRLAEGLGVEFAFPTRTVHLVQAGQESAEDAAPAPTSMSDLRARVTGIRRAQDLVAHQPWQRERPGPVVYTAGPTPLDGLEEDEIPGEERRET